MTERNDKEKMATDKKTDDKSAEGADMHPKAEDLAPLQDMKEADLASLEERIIREKQKHMTAKQTQQAQAQQTGMKAGSEFLAAVLGGGVVGFFADKFLGTSPLILFIMVTVGFAYGIYRAYSVMNDIDQKKE